MKSELLKQQRELIAKAENLETLIKSMPNEYDELRAAKNYKYYFLDDEGFIHSDIEQYSAADERRYNLGNYFKTKKEAQQTVEDLTMLHDLRKRYGT